MSRDRRQLPQGHIEAVEDLPRRGMPQPLDVLIGDATKAEAVGDVVDGAQKPRKAVGQRAVEIEDGEGVGQWGNGANIRPAGDALTDAVGDVILSSSEVADVGAIGKDNGRSAA